ncbi:deoxyribodipyrimidine photo-lyase [Rhodoferax sp.]|uniref:cryptochrome/photolyase family protein n=1 Tax=Rhodoferax sp. TaxID=50421 RepID=UPI0025CE1256|nr:deoxyribodipyrimidine photo-lyase [Rhodoferax sp.]
MHSHFTKGLVWFRRDLRATDNAALALATASCDSVYCVFVFDKAILGHLPRADRRVEFIHGAVSELQSRLRALQPDGKGGLIVLHADAVDAIPELAAQLEVQAVFAARDYEPAAVERDTAVQQQLLRDGKQLMLVKDQVVFEEREVLTQMGKPYGVFTPYHRAWLARIGSGLLAQSHLQEGAAATLAALPADVPSAMPSLESLGFEPTNLKALGIHSGESGGQALLDDFVLRMDRYGEARDFPGLKGPSYLGVHLRFGTVSIRHLVNLALERVRAGSAGASVWLAELAWRDFYFQILANFPRVATHAFKPEYDHIAWEQGERAQTLYAAWCEGRTGYPIVDAAMAQLNQTGYMHNRLRMVAGSFLVKHLGLDWRWGERYFAVHLNDFDLSANNGGWQWVASSGCDAQPYFRIFNPVTQSERFDAQGKFIRRYLPQLAGLSDKAIHAPWAAKPMEMLAAGVQLGVNYPAPIVDHAGARERTLARYGFLKKSVDQAGTAVEQ